MFTLLQGQFSGLRLAFTISNPPATDHALVNLGGPPSPL